MTCEGSKQAVWSELDGERVPGLAEHLALCPSCRRYAAQARRLHERLPAAFPAAPVPDFSPAVLSVLRTKRRTDAPAWLLPAAAAAAALVLYLGFEPLDLEGAAADLQGQWNLLLGEWTFFAGRCAEVSASLGLPALFAAAAAWLFTVHQEGRSPAQPAGGRS